MAERVWYFLFVVLFPFKWVRNVVHYCTFSMRFSSLVDEGMSRGGYGASVLDLIFPQPETVNEIRFRNWYTARLSLLVRFDDSVQAPPKKEHLAWAAAAVKFNPFPSIQPTNCFF